MAKTPSRTRWWRRRYRVEAVAADGSGPLGVDTGRRFWTWSHAHWHAGTMNCISARGGLVRYIVTDHATTENPPSAASHE